MRKMWMTVVVALVMTFSLMGGTAFAEGKEKGECRWEQEKGDLEWKVLDKAHFLMKNQEELGLSSEQIAKIHDLKMNTKKDMIRRNAEIEVLALDIKSALHAEKIDTKAVNGLIDKKYELKKEKTKALVGAYASLKEIPTKEQKETMKALWKKCEKEKEK